MEINFLKWFNFQRGQIIYNKIVERGKKIQLDFRKEVTIMGGLEEILRV